MVSNRESVHGQWSSRWAFILAATGSAVGLGNIWKFPYIAGENGGGAFVLIYLICICLIGVPIMIAEIMLGRRGRKNPIMTMETLAKEEGASPKWKVLGLMGVLAGFIILSYYSVIAGWAMSYIFKSASGLFVATDAETVGNIFSRLVSSPLQLMIWHTLFMVITMLVVARGVRAGLEKAVFFLMPGMFIILLLLVGFAMAEGNFAQGFAFLFSPDFSKVEWGSVLTAMGHAFFTLSLGMGAIMIYGSYLPDNVSIAKTGFMVAAADTLVALLAGLAIFPIVFVNNLEPGAGPGLVFQTLPIAFGQMPGGVIVATLFFVMLVFAAWSSAISLIEPAVTWLVERKEMTRKKACVISGLFTWLLGIGTVLSFNEWSFSFMFAGQEKTAGIFDILDILTANIMLPLGGLLIAVFAGWKMAQSSTLDELGMAASDFGYKSWCFLVRYVTPVAVIIIMMKALAIF
ncbi:MAG: sodium-dependent transporter [Gammaproteobacteria bacterium]